MNGTNTIIIVIQEINMGCVQCGVRGVRWVRDLVCVMEAGRGFTWVKCSYVYMRIVIGRLWYPIMCVWSVYVHYMRILYVCTGL